MKNTTIASIAVFCIGTVLIVVVLLTGFFEKEPPKNWTIGEAVGTLAGSDTPIKLISVCIGEETKTVECTFIPLDESLRTPKEKELAERAEKE